LKRSVLLVLLAFGLVAMVSAHGPKRAERPAPGSAGPRNPGARAEIKPVTVSGDIIIVRGSPAVKSGDVTYILNRSFSLFGLVDGLKEGAKVTIEGRTMGTRRDEKIMFLLPSKLTFNGKTYDNLESPAFHMGPGRDVPGRAGPRQPEKFRHHDSYRNNRR